MGIGIGIGKFQVSVNRHRQSFGYRHRYRQKDLVSAHHYLGRYFARRLYIKIYSNLTQMNICIKVPINFVIFQE